MPLIERLPSWCKTPAQIHAWLDGFSVGYTRRVHEDSYEELEDDPNEKLRDEGEEPEDEPEELDEHAILFNIAQMLDIDMDENIGTTATDIYDAVHELKQRSKPRKGKK